jgi:hypothetical protein
MTKKIFRKLLVLLTIAVFLLSTTHMVAAENTETQVEDTIEIGPGKH